MIIQKQERNGIVRKLWDDATRQYTERDEDGVITVTRPYSPEENAETDAEVARSTDRTAVRAIVAEIKLEQDRAQTVIDSATASKEDKDNARAIKRMGAAVISLAKFVKDQ